MASSSLDLSYFDNSHYENVVEAQVTTEAFHARLFRTRWRSNAMAAFSPPLPFIEMALGSTGLVSASYRPRPAPEELIRLGDVTFIPKDAMLHYRTQPGSQRTISCMFDIDRLAGRAGMSGNGPSSTRTRRLTWATTTFAPACAGSPRNSFPRALPASTRSNARCCSSQRKSCAFSMAARCSRPTARPGSADASFRSCAKW